MKSFLTLIENIHLQQQIFKKTALVSQYFKEISTENCNRIFHLILFNHDYILSSEEDLYQWFIESNLYEKTLIEDCFEITDNKLEIIALFMQNTDAKESSLPDLLQEIYALKNSNRDEIKAFIFHQWNTLDGQEMLLFNLIITGKISEHFVSKVIFRVISLRMDYPEDHVKSALSRNWNPHKVSISEVLQGNNHEHSEIVFYHNYNKKAVAFSEINPEDYIYSCKDIIEALLIKHDEKIFIQYSNNKIQSFDEQIIIEKIKNIPDQTVFQTFIHPKNDIQEVENKISGQQFPLDTVKKIEIIDIVNHPDVHFDTSRYADRLYLLQRFFPDRQCSDIVQTGTLLHKEEVLFGWCFPGNHLLSHPVPVFQHPFHHIIAVLTHATLGVGKRQTFYTDFTFSVYEDSKLKSIIKLTSHQCRDFLQPIHQFIAKNTVQKFGNMIAVKPEFICEFNFEKIDRSTNPGKPFILKNVSIKRNFKSISLSGISDIKDLNTFILP